MSDTTYTRLIGGYVGSGHGDVLGVLLGETDAGWVMVAQHVSSGPTWSQRDIMDHHAAKIDSSIPREWLGQLPPQNEMRAKYPPAPLEGS